MNWEIVDAISFFSFAAIFYFLSVLSKRLGEVMGVKKYYYLYYAGIAFALLGSAAMISLSGVENFALLGYFFFSAGLTCAVVASVKYWGWLFKEAFKG